MEKCIVMFSGGLDSRLSVKIMQEQGYKVMCLFFKLPFEPQGNDKISLKMQGAELKIFDCTKGELLQEYLEVIKEAKNGRGSGVNPCRDCRIFMLKKAKEFADAKKIKLIVTGEVLDERPMSQTKKSIRLIEREADLAGRIYRPLIEIYKIQGRRRLKQIELARKFKIDYPEPGGGCLLCEKNLKERFKFLFKRGINETELLLTGVGRHFVIDGSWIVIGRNEEESKIIERVGGDIGKLIVSENIPAPSAVIISKEISKGIINKTENLVKAYSKEGSLEERKKFEEWKI
jgi:7-cyano-7-deazaguanine synthase in queuosine biosynthesis